MKVQNFAPSLQTGVCVGLVQCFTVVVLECLCIYGCGAVFLPNLLCMGYKVLLHACRSQVWMPPV